LKQEKAAEFFVFSELISKHKMKSRARRKSPCQEGEKQNLKDQKP